ncbi:conserved oligomeric Golgi complex subunit 4-like [Octopus sinensis]|uniref:Conserved oligomeric Golgi complex subunit 4 n=1 Tax=Octopus sinensis TaxID=2607531 RepID=A0A6P7SK82_9MOLL|nr:conserved oligomeric Golgi complex subunit 4-like [Octopus sinensis]
MAGSKDDATSSDILEAADKLTDIDKMKEALDRLCHEEEIVNEELNSLLEHQSLLENKMFALHKMLPNLHVLDSDAKQLSTMISFTSTLAENVSSKVRQLDVAKSHVSDSIQRVEDVLDLKFCTDGVQSALQNEDYEKAAGHVHRFLSLDENVLRMAGDASEGSPLDTSFKMLHEAEEKLKTIVRNKFDASVHSGDVASVERFFKIFPLLRLHEEGLTKFGKYLAAQFSEPVGKTLSENLKITDDDKRSNILFADVITTMFERIARIVETHQPLVETFYGPGKLDIILMLLQKECDRQARTTIKEFRKRRDFDYKVQQVQQSMLFSKSSNEKLDFKQLDVLLSELVLLNTRAELYIRFMKKRSLNDIDVGIQDVELKKEKHAIVERNFNNCDLSRLMQDLIGNYILMEEYFMREMVLKAVSMDLAEENSLYSSMVDDSFFIVKKSVRRAISSSSVDGVCAMLNHACTILEQDFRETLYSKLRPGFPSGFDFSQAYNLMQSSFQQGKLSSDTEKAKTVFLITLNNAEASCDYIKSLHNSLEAEVAQLFRQCSEQNKAKLETCLNDLGSVSARFKDVIEFGFSQLSTSAIKPRIKPLVEALLSSNHNITEDEFSNYEANDPWIQNFILNLDGMLVSFKASFTVNNYDRFVGVVTNEITAQLEKTVLKTTFNRLGGLQFDKELRALASYLTSVTTWTIRDKFARLTQMATILNLERVTEILDYWGPNSGPLTWRLTPTEVRQALALRVDFRSEDIRRLKL